MTAARLIAAHALRESVRRRVFHVVIVLTVVAGGLYALGVSEAFSEVETYSDGVDVVDERELTGATLLGLAMFGALFLGAVLAGFLTLGAVRGDAERGLLQPVLVRPLPRRTVLLARFLAAGAVAGPYVLLVYSGAVLVIGAIGGWWPDSFVRTGLELAVAVLVVAALALLGSVFLSSVANGIAVFMTFGAGLVAGLLGQIGEALDSDRLERVSEVASWLLPFEALYQRGLDQIAADTEGTTRVIVTLGPFGGANAASGWLVAWALAYIAAVMALAVVAFGRRDL